MIVIGFLILFSFPFWCFCCFHIERGKKAMKKIHKKIYAHCHLIVLGFILVRFIQSPVESFVFVIHLFITHTFIYFDLFRAFYLLWFHTHTRACIGRMYVIWIAFFFIVCCCNSPFLFLFAFLCWIRRNHDLFRIERFFSSLRVLQIHMFISLKHKALSRVKEEGNRCWDDKKYIFHLKNKQKKSLT